MKRNFFLIAFLILARAGLAQEAVFGNNDLTGHYVTAPDSTRLYYEVYGSGPPLLLLHGDTFGYISEFEYYIPLLSEHFKVIVPALRGHGKSAIGHSKFSYRLFAQDALTILKQERADTAVVIGFSAGATTAYYLAANHSNIIRKVVAMGGATRISDLRPGVFDDLMKYTGDDYHKMLPELVESRKKLMPVKDSYGRLVEQLKNSWAEQVYIDPVALGLTTCKILTIGGDRDEYFPVESFVKIHRAVQYSNLAIIPDCDHLGLILKPSIINDIVLPFLGYEKRNIQGGSD